MIRDERNILQCSSTLLALADANDVVSAESSLLAHASEDGVGLVEQDERVADLDDFSSVHDDDPVVKGDGGEPTGQGEQSDQSEIDYKKNEEGHSLCDTQERLVLELEPDRVLNISIRLDVDRGRRFVEKDDLGVSYDDSRQRKQL